MNRYVKTCPTWGKKRTTKITCCKCTNNIVSQEHYACLCKLVLSWLIHKSKLLFRLILMLGSLDFPHSSSVSILLYFSINMSIVIGLSHATEGLIYLFIFLEMRLLKGLESMHSVWALIKANVTYCSIFTSFSSFICWALRVDKRPEKRPFSTRSNHVIFHAHLTQGQESGLFIDPKRCCSGVYTWGAWFQSQIKCDMAHTPLSLSHSHTDIWLL